MKINRLLFNDPHYFLEGEIDFSSYPSTSFHVKKIPSCKVKITGQNYDDLFVMEVEVEALVISCCARSLEEVEVPLRYKDHIEISNEVEDDEDIYFEKDNIFDVDPYILSSIIAETPTVVYKKDSKAPLSGDGYRVISEDQYLKEQEEKKDSRWDKLDDIDL